VGAWVPYVK